MTADAAIVLDELRLATPDIGARRTHLIFEAAHGAMLDPLHRAHILGQYADPDVPNASGLFTDLITAIDRWVEARAMGDNDHDDAGYSRPELVDKRADDIERIAANLVPSPTEYIADDSPLTSFDEPQAGAA